MLAACGGGAGGPAPSTTTLTAKLEGSFGGTAAPAPAPPAPAPPAPSLPAPVEPAPAADPQYGTCKEAIAAGYGDYVRGTDPEYDWYQDRDGDGIVCER